MSLYELEKNTPENNQTIVDNLVIAYSKINSPLYDKIICTVSGGYDSDIVVDISTKCDINHKVTYIFFNTGIEYEATKEHIKYLEKKYGIEIIEKRPKKPIPVACAEYGVPFISKKVSEYIGRLQKHGFKWEDKSFDELFEEYPNCKTALRWWCNEWGEGSRFNISRNKYLKEYMIDNPPPMKISSDCCKYGKKDILHAAIKDGGYDLNLTGMRRAEGGARSTAFTSCFKENDAGCDLYMPVWWYTDTDKEIYREYYNIERSKCYTEYGLKRTGCAGCPYGRDFKKELDIIKQYEPKLYKAVNHIFGESYRYTRNYRAYVAFMEQKK